MKNAIRLGILCLLFSTRRDFRAGARNIWQYIPRTSNNWVSEFGNLEGLTDIKPQKQIELQPYVVGKLESFEREEGNPFATGNDRGLGIGLDGKVGVTGDLTLDFTINPDFGQVEADPAAINLDGFVFFFQNSGLFFIEMDLSVPVVESRSIAVKGFEVGTKKSGLDQMPGRRKPTS